MTRLWRLGALLMVANCSTPSEQRIDLEPVDAGGKDADTMVATDAGTTMTVTGGVDPAVCVPLISKRCEYLTRCGLISADPDTAKECTAFFDATWCGPKTWVPRTMPSVNTLRFDANKAKACAAAYEARSCADWSTLPEACGQFLVPNAQLRQTCYDGYAECAEGVCRGISCGDRRCRPLGQESEDCRTTSDCASGLYCRATNTLGVGVCSKPASVGETCTEHNTCADGLTCLGQCLALPPVGAPCVMGRCDTAGFCMQGLDGGFCAPRLLEGVRCAGDGQCATGTVCDATRGQCVPATVSQPGQTCGAQQSCIAGLVCIAIPPDSKTPVCESPSPAAATCTSSSECQNQLACTGGRCVSRGQWGAACRSARDCGIFLGCIEGTCQPRPVIGQPCTSLMPCLWGACSPLVDGGTVCTDPAGPGARCASNDACASGRCVQGQCLAACTP